MTRPRFAENSRPTGVRFSRAELELIRRACLVIEGRQNYPARFGTFVRFAAVRKAEAIIRGEQSEAESAAEELEKLAAAEVPPLPSSQEEIPIGVAEGPHEAPRRRRRKSKGGAA